MLNIALASVIIAAINYVVVPLERKDFRYTHPASKQAATDTKTEAAQPPSLNPSDFTIIAEQNLFHPDRKIPAEKKAETQKLQPEFILYGTLISDDISLAYVEDKKSPRSTQGRGNRQTALKKGETLSGFTLKEIEKDKIVMVREEERMVVQLTDSSKAKSRGSSAAPSVQTQPAPAAAVQTKAEEQKTAAPKLTTPQTSAEKKQFASEQEKTASESAKKTLLDFFKLPAPAR